MIKEMIKRKLMYNMSIVEDGMYSSLMSIDNDKKANKENLELYIGMLKECIELNEEI